MLKILCPPSCTCVVVALSRRAPSSHSSTRSLTFYNLSTKACQGGAYRLSSYLPPRLAYRLIYIASGLSSTTIYCASQNLFYCPPLCSSRRSLTLPPSESAPVLSNDWKAAAAKVQVPALDTPADLSSGGYARTNLPVTAEAWQFSKTEYSQGRGGGGPDATQKPESQTARGPA